MAIKLPKPSVSKKTKKKAKPKTETPDVELIKKLLEERYTITGKDERLVTTDDRIKTTLEREEGVEMQQVECDDHRPVLMTKRAMNTEFVTDEEPDKELSRALNALKNSGDCVSQPSHSIVTPPKALAEASKPFNVWNTYQDILNNLRALIEHFTKEKDYSAVSDLARFANDIKNSIPQISQDPCRTWRNRPAMHRNRNCNPRPIQSSFEEQGFLPATPTAPEGAARQLHSVTIDDFLNRLEQSGALASFMKPAEEKPKKAAAKKKSLKKPKR